MEDNKAVQQEYESFLQQTVNSREVWILDGEQGMACQESVEFEDKMAVLFWSNALMAEIERDAEFDGLETTSLSLFDFMFQWLPNMHEEGVVCALNWNQENGGLEIIPGDLLDHFNTIIPDELEAEFKEKLASS